MPLIDLEMLDLHPKSFLSVTLNITCDDGSCIIMGTLPRQGTCAR